MSVYFFHADQMYQLAGMDKFPFGRGVNEKRNQIDVLSHV